MGRHGDDRRTREPGRSLGLANPARRLEPIQLRHLHVHEDQVEIAIGQSAINGLLAIDCHDRGIAPFGEQADGQLLIGNAVFGEQNSQRSAGRRGGGLLIGFESGSRNSQTLHQRVVEFGLFHRFDQLRGDPQFLAERRVACPSGRREHDKYGGLQGLVAAAALDELETVDGGHIDVRQNDRKRTARPHRVVQEFMRLIGAAGRNGHHPPVLQDLVENPPIGGVVIDDENLGSQNLRRADAAGDGRRRIGNVEGRHEVKGAAVPGSAFDPNLALHQLDQS